MVCRLQHTFSLLLTVHLLYSLIQVRAEEESRECRELEYKDRSGNCKPCKQCDAGQELSKGRAMGHEEGEALYGDFTATAAIVQAKMDLLGPGLAQGFNVRLTCVWLEVLNSSSSIPTGRCHHKITSSPPTSIFMSCQPASPDPDPPYQRPLPTFLQDCMPRQ